MVKRLLKLFHQKQHNNYFVDSYTTVHSIARKTAVENGIPTIARNVFLDYKRAEATIAKQFQQLIAIAKQRGNAVAIGHPYPTTILYLEKALPNLAQQVVQLFPVSKMIEKQHDYSKTINIVARMER